MAVNKTICARVFISKRQCIYKTLKEVQSSRHLSIESNRNGYLFFRAEPSCEKFC